MKKIFTAVADYWNGYSFAQKIFFICLWSIGLHLPICFGDFISHDEQYTLVLMQKSVTEMLHLIVLEDGHPPLSYLFYRLLAFGDWETMIHTMRIVGFTLYALGMCALGYWPVRRLLNEKTALWFVFLAMFMPISFYLSANIRMYVFACLFLTGEFVYALNIAFKRRKGDWIYFTIFSVLGLYSHYYCSLVSALIWLMLFYDLWRQKEYRELKHIFGCGAITAICFLPWVYAFLQQYLQLKTAWYPSLFEMQTAFRGFFESYILPPLFIDIICGLMFILLLFKKCFCSKNIEMSVKVVRRALFIALGLYLSAWAISLILRPMLVGMYLAVIRGIVYLAVVSALPQKPFRKALFVLIVVLEIAGNFNNYYDYSHLNLWKRGVNVINSHVAENDVILYGDTHAHMFLRTSLPEANIYYAPLEPELILLHDEVAKETITEYNIDKTAVYGIYDCHSRKKYRIGTVVERFAGLYYPLCLLKFSADEVQILLDKSQPIREQSLY
ncbi:MAG: glycosyltransferase family 39 protein [Alphaproteobacteria bacterium]|nr:glycosyltransferase family 39 protein [Alphaproteobacteria bacterium]